MILEADKNIVKCQQFDRPVQSPSLISSIAQTHMAISTLHHSVSDQSSKNASDFDNLVLLRYSICNSSTFSILFSAGELHLIMVDGCKKKIRILNIRIAVLRGCKYHKFVSLDDNLPTVLNTVE